MGWLVGLGRWNSKSGRQGARFIFEEMREAMGLENPNPWGFGVQCSSFDVPLLPTSAFPLPLRRKSLIKCALHQSKGALQVWNETLRHTKGALLEVNIALLRVKRALLGLNIALLRVKRALLGLNIALLRMKRALLGLNIALLRVKLALLEANIALQRARGVLRRAQGALLQAQVNCSVR